MNTEILGVILQIVLMVGLAFPLGKYIAKVYKGERTCLDFLKPVERWMYKLSGVNPDEEMGWKSSSVHCSWLTCFGLYGVWCSWSHKVYCRSTLTATSDRHAIRHSTPVSRLW